MDETINIGRTIARERRRTGMTQAALAEHLGVSKAAVSKWELGQSLPDVSLLPRIAAIFSLTLDELFDWRDKLSEQESAALYAEVYALGAHDLVAAHERLRALAADHYSDVNLLLMLASLLTIWAAGMATPFAQADACGTELDSSALAEEALALLDRALDIAADPAALYLAQQQKATTLFQMERYDEAAAVLEPLVRHQDAGAPTMLLASAQRKLGRDDAALELLQTERLRAANFILSSLVQEMGTRGDTAFARKAAAAATAIFQMLDMGGINPWYPATMALEKAEVLRDAGEQHDALEALAAALDAVEAASDAGEAAASPLWDHVAGYLDPSRSGEAWAAHKQQQGEALRESMRRGIAEQALSPAWRACAGDDARYRHIVEVAKQLARTPAPHREG